MNDMYDTCPPVRPSIRSSHTRVSLTNSQPSLDAKVVVMGSAGVGKTSLVTRYVEGRFGQTTTTTGAFFYSKKAIVNGTKVRLQIWDTAARTLPIHGEHLISSSPSPCVRGSGHSLPCITEARALLFSSTTLPALPPSRMSSFGLMTSLHKANGLSPLTGPTRAPYLVPPASPTHLVLGSYNRPRHPKTEGVYDSYIRPRLTSLTSSRSVPFGFGSVSLSTLAGVTTGRLPSPMAEVSSGASATSASSSGAPHEEGRDTSILVREERGREKRRTRSGGRDLEIAEFARGMPSWSTRRGRSTDDVVVEDDETEEEESWGLGKGMQLREVSAKDDRGIQNLFDVIIKEIIKRKDVLERDRIAKERDSIVLNPSWNRVAEEEEAAMSRKSGGSCCAV
ncbi:Ras of Complex, Roc, domain of DAPkinase [Rhizoctonia solani]|uniref:Ras of Complex, Roc, domain of DAPkinase n=1 Tax=Rhizoctonia solani TaxID=456999 RepID=A0A8H7IJ28_9AGAM|nr:Ras of Complex, Roc, domain of DAPkinase [Rhizoctonia solani]